MTLLEYCYFLGKLGEKEILKPQFIALLKFKQHSLCMILLFIVHYIFQYIFCVHWALIHSCPLHFVNSILYLLHLIFKWIDTISGFLPELLILRLITLILSSASTVTLVDIDGGKPVLLAKHPHHITSHLHWIESV